MNMQEDITHAQREELHNDLKGQRAELEELLADRAGLTSTVELDQSAVGRITRIDALQAQKMAQALHRRHALRLQRTVAALERYAEDPEEFGFCLACGECIGFGRLKAKPESFLCVPCLQEKEGSR